MATDSSRSSQNVEGSQADSQRSSTAAAVGGTRATHLSHNGNHSHYGNVYEKAKNSPKIKEARVFSSKQSPKGKLQERKVEILGQRIPDLRKTMKPTDTRGVPNSNTITRIGKETGKGATKEGLGQAEKGIVLRSKICRGPTFRPKPRVQKE